MQVSKKTADPAEAVLREIEEMGKRSFIPSIGPVKGRIIAEIVAKLKPRKILEVGSLYGYSAILIAKNSPAKAEITTVEKNPEHARITEQNVERAKLEDQIKVIREASWSPIMWACFRTRCRTISTMSGIQAATGAGRSIPC